MKRRKEDPMIESEGCIIYESDVCQWVRNASARGEFTGGVSTRDGKQSMGEDIIGNRDKQPKFPSVVNNNG